MDNIWHVFENEHTIKDNAVEGNTFMPEYAFFEYYLKLLIRDRDWMLMPKKVIFHLDGTRQSMPYILNSLHHLRTQCPEVFQQIEFDFQSSNPCLVQAYSQIVYSMREHNQVAHT